METSTQMVTIRLPTPIYRQVESRARSTRRSVEKEVVAAISSTLDDLPADLADEMAQMQLMADDELWQAARAALPSDDSERMQTLVDKQQRETLTARERVEAERLVRRSQRIMLVRAQAAALLHDRGYDISSLGPAPVAL